MNVQRLGADAQLLSDDAVGLAGAHKFEHFAFARGQLGHALGDGRAFAADLVHVLFHVQGAADGLQGLLFAEGLLQHVHGAFLDRLHGQGNVGVGAEDDDRDGDVVLDQVLVQLGAAHAGHAQVEHQAADVLVLIAFEKFFRRSEADQVETSRLHEDLERGAHTRVVIHQTDIRPRVLHFHDSFHLSAASLE
jgi:hypothetical protein